MSRTNLSILLATGLLGVLLWLVDSIVSEYAFIEMANGPTATTGTQQPGTSRPETESREQPAVQTVTASELPVEPTYSGPRMRSADDLTALLNQLGLDATVAIRMSQAWFDQHGFLGANKLFGRDAKSSPARRYEDYDDATLLALAGPGDLGALEALAAKSAESDPSEAYSWYRQAASYGSIKAMIDIGLLLDQWKQSAEAFGTDSVYRDKVEALFESTSDAEQPGLTWIITAARIGGLPALKNRTVIDLLRNPDPGADSDVIETACRRSAKLMLKLAGERRTRGQIIFTQEPPPVFLAERDLNELLPCQEQVVPIVDTSSCAAQSVTPGPDLPATLWICVNR